MGFWSSTFGGGNSFSESVANVSTPNDGARYSGGNLVDERTGSGISSGGQSSSGNTISGNAGSSSTGTGSTVGSSPSSYIQKGLMSAIPGLSIVGKLAGWANGLDPENQKGAVIGGRQTYKNPETGFTYSYNAVGLPYEVRISDDGTSVTDALQAVGADGQTGYQRMASAQRSSGNSSGAAAIEQEAADNANEADTQDTVGTTTEQILAMAEAAGMLQSNEDTAALLADPQAWLDSRGINLSDLVPTIDADAAGTTLDGSDPKYSLGDSLTTDAALVNDIATTTPVVASDVEGFDASTVSDLLGTEATTVNAATGDITDDSFITAEQIDMTGAATGVNADGSTSVLGEALNNFASQSISTMIDTSTAAGKLLAQKLGEGNYTDSKATILGQMGIISAEFKDSNGDPKIPAWAQGVSRDVARTMAFAGVTGTAAVAAMSNAVMEATLGIAKDEATFFQTLTISNLDNRQQSIINKASVLANFEMANLDARQQSAVENAKSFLQMDMANLTNEQQAEVINKQASVEALFNDQAAINAARLFNASETNDSNQYFAGLAATVDMANTAEINDARAFNAGETNDNNQYFAGLENERQQFYANMQYNIDKSTAEWRQTVTLAEAEMAYEAAAVDVQNTLDISTEALNQTWDRVDNTLDYIFKGWNAESDRDATILASQIRAQAESSGGGNGFMDGLFKLGAAWISR